MSSGQFFQYDGSFREIPCPVKDYVFSNLDTSQIKKVHAGINSEFGEVWWFYPTSSGECDRYVVYDVQQQVWHYGSIVRTAWAGNYSGTKPLGASTDGYLYQHETGFNDGSSNPPTSIAAYIQSSPVELGEGDGFTFVNRIIPDLTFRASDNASPTATITLKGTNFPGADFSQTDSGSVAQTASGTVEEFTNQLHVRVRGRAIAFRVESDLEDTNWRLGIPRIEARTDGRR